MSVSANKNREKFIRAATAALNVAANDELWKGFGYDGRPRVFKKDHEMFTRLFLFEIAMARTIGREQKVLKLLKKEEFREIAQKIIDYGRLSAKDSAEIVIAQTQYYLHNDYFCLQEYFNCTDELPSMQWKKGAICSMYVMQQYLRPAFDRGEKITPSMITEWAKGINIMSIQQFSELAKDKGVPKEIREGIEKMLDETSEESQIGVLRLATNIFNKEPERQERTRETTKE